MRRAKILIVIVISIMTTACDFYPTPLKIENHSEETVYFCLGFSSHQTLFPGEFTYRVAPGDTIRPILHNFGRGDGRELWTHSINHSSPDSCLLLFFMRDSIVTEGMVRDGDFEMYSFSPVQLDSLDWTVVYGID